MDKDKFSWRQAILIVILICGGMFIGIMWGYDPVIVFLLTIIALKKIQG